MRERGKSKKKKKGKRVSCWQEQLLQPQCRSFRLNWRLVQPDGVYRRRRMQRRPCSVVCEIDSADKTTALLCTCLAVYVFSFGFILLDSTVITQQHAAPPWHQPAIYIQIRIRWIRNGSFLFLSSGLPAAILFQPSFSLPPLFSPLSPSLWVCWGQVSTNVTWLSLKTGWTSLSNRLSEVGEWRQLGRSFWAERNFYLTHIGAEWTPSTITTPIKLKNKLHTKLSHTEEKRADDRLWPHVSESWTTTVLS